jgi:hypothetical protein
MKFYFGVKCYQTALRATEKPFVKGGANRFDKFHCCLILRNCHNHPSLQPLPDQSAAINIEARKHHQQKD